MADGVRIDDRQLRVLSRRLQKMADKFPGIVEKETHEWLKEQRGVLKSTPYPPKRAGQKYVRTGRLPSSYAVRRIGSRWGIENRRPGSKWVVGRTQARIHQNRWYKAINVIKRGLSGLRNRIRTRIKAL